jgi:hypothetical protein
MTRDDIIGMVQEVIVTDSNDNPFDFRLTTVEQIERFAALVAAAEREACWDIVSTALFREDRELTRRVASAIRARGQA